MAMRRARVGSTIDMSRLSAAVSRPGIDPRIWCSIAYAAGESKIDAKHGDFLDVVLLPCEQRCTVRVPQAYAGKDFGSNEGRIHKDDEVIVLFPDGDPAAGGIVVARLWSAADPPPDLAFQNEKDIVKVLEKDISWRVKLQGSGIADLIMEASLHIKAPDHDVVKLDKDGLELGVNPTDYMALASLVKAEISALRDSVAAFVTAYGTHTHPTAAPGPPSPPASPATAPAPVNDVKSAFVKSK
mgnify:CR=1 FL=1